MQTRVTVTSDYDHISHTWYPAVRTCHSFGTLRFGDTEVYLYTPADIDAVTAELAALRAEMTGEADDDEYRLCAVPECPCDGYRPAAPAQDETPAAAAS